MFYLTLLAILFARWIIGGRLMGCLNYLILSFIEGKIIEIIGDLERTDP